MPYLCIDSLLQTAEDGGWHFLLPRFCLLPLKHAPLMRADSSRTSIRPKSLKLENYMW